MNTSKFWYYKPTWIYFWWQDPHFITSYHSNCVDCYDYKGNHVYQENDKWFWAYSMYDDKDRETVHRDSSWRNHEYIYNIHWVMIQKTDWERLWEYDNWRNILQNIIY
jgi:hypothetical protein